MTQDLVRENQELRRQLEELMASARRNEDVMRRFLALELELLGAGGFQELIDTILIGVKAAFDLDAVSLVLFDPEYELRRMLDALRVGVSDYPDLKFREDEAALRALFRAPALPALGSFESDRHGELFGTLDVQAASVAILPLVRAGKLLGTLNFASRAPDRFLPTMATDFLERLAIFTAVCLDTVTNGERVRRLSLTDMLTGAYNRRFFEQRLIEEVSRATRQSAALGCLFIDLDHFKNVNDRFGHQAGDWVLQELTAVIKSQLRLSDMLARYGGEEFAVLLPNTDVDGSAAVAERIRWAVAGRVYQLADDARLSLTLSIGVSALVPGMPATDPEATGKTLVAEADEALYRAKTLGRNRVVRFETAVA